MRPRLVILVAVTLGLIIATAFVPRIPQDPAYHNFADQRAFFGIPHFFDVISNVPFFFVGLWGLLITLRSIRTQERWAYLTLFAGVLLTCFGSAYYHWEPNNQTLVWDRLPMTIAFTGLLSAIISERIDHGLGLRLLTPLILLGLASVIYWNRTELAGSGDLRPYVLVQFGSLLLLVLVLLLFRARYTGTRYLIYAFGLYILAKSFEQLDAPIYHALRILSGHTLKHLVAAAAIALIVIAFKQRRLIVPLRLA
jgi:hypothetical protein